MDIYLEQYCKTVNVEAKQTIEMAKTMIFPAAIRYQSELASTCANLKAVGYKFDTDTLDKMTELVKELQDSTAELEKTPGTMTAAVCSPRRSITADKIVPAMAAVRKSADELEGFVADDLLAAADLPGNAVYQVK